MVFSRAFICFAFLSVCTAIATAQFPNSGRTVRWRTVASGSSSTETRQKLQLASERTELENLWTPVLKQNRSQPIVDFNKDRLVVIFLGTRNTGGYSAQVSSVGDAGGASATIFVNELYPGPKQKVTQMQTSPWVMIAVDRSYLDLNAKIQKVEDNQLPSFAINPLTTFTPMPWGNCGYGYGGSWVDPCGYGFDSYNDFGSWCNRNQIDYPNIGGIDFRSNRLVFISGGDYGLGFGLQIGDIFLSGQETIVQIRRGPAIQERKRSFLLVSISRDTQKYAVEYLVDGRDCFVDSGNLLPVQQAGAWIFRNEKECGNIVRPLQGVAVPNSVGGFDYRNGNLAVISMPQQLVTMRVGIDRVAYRGNTAYVYLTRSANSNPINMNLPYFLLKVDKKITGIKVIDPNSR